MPGPYEPPGTGRLSDPIHPWLCLPRHLIVQGSGSGNEGDMNEIKWRTTINFTNSLFAFAYFQIENSQKSIKPSTSK